MYERIAKKLAAGRNIILDGGTGTDIQRRGAPMSAETWCADANMTHPQIVKAVHEDYIRAGAEDRHGEHIRHQRAAVQRAGAR